MNDYKDRRKTRDPFYPDRRETALSKYMNKHGVVLVVLIWLAVVVFDLTVN
jgi:hypothetical protein